MGQFSGNLFYRCVIFFQTVGEVTIHLWSFSRYLIVLIISSMIHALVTTLHRRRKHTIGPRGTYFMSGFGIACIIVLFPALYYVAIHELPHPRMLTQRTIPITTKIFDRNGVLLYEMYADENRTPVSLAELPEHFKQATLAIEDKHFYQHKGFSFEGITRAAYATFLKHDLQGGSTITQQLVRSALLNHDITFERKIKELIVSIWTERLYAKDQILEMYFNQVPYGGTAWGAESAAQRYFGKSIRDVNLPEAALLAGLPAAPTTFSPFGAHPEYARERQSDVLRRMVEEGFITDSERKEAEAYNLTFSQPSTNIQAPHFVMYVRDLLARRYGMRMVEQGGLRVTTSLDANLQNHVQAIVTEEVKKIRHLNVGNGAAIVTDPATGEILAMVGSTGYFDIEHEGNVNVALTPQQPGSAVKVVTYAAALQHGYTAATLLNDTPVTYTIAGNSPYKPVNYDGTYHGMVTLRQALGNSYNIPAVRTVADIGVERVLAQGKDMGITSWEDSSRYGLSITLGGGELTLLDMASVYNTLANKGTFQELTPVLTVTDYQGTILEDNRGKKGVQAVPEGVAFIISDILADNTARSSAFGFNSLLNVPHQWAPVKTGTSNEKRDNLAIGYTNSAVVTVWVGNNDNTPMHPSLTSGITGATPIWRRIIDILTKDTASTPPEIPASVVVSFCNGRKEYFLKGTEKKDCRQSPLPIDNKQQTTEDSPRPTTVYVQQTQSNQKPIPNTPRKNKDKKRR